MCSSSGEARPAAPAPASWYAGARTWRSSTARSSRGSSCAADGSRRRSGTRWRSRRATTRAVCGSGTPATSATAARSGPSVATAGSSAASSWTTSCCAERRRAAPGRRGPRHRARRRRPLVGRGSARAPPGRRRRAPTVRSRACSRRRGRAGRSAFRSTSSAPIRAAIARTRAGRDGEPELLLHDDLRGYSWNVPKTDWLNVGSGTVEPHEVRAAWQKARAHFSAAGHVPPRSAAELEAMKGHTYYLFDPAHLEGAVRAGATNGKGGGAPLRRQPGAGAAAHRRGHPARGDLGPPGRRGDPGRRAGELPGAAGRPSGDRGLPARLPPARGGRGARRRSGDHKGAGAGNGNGNGNGKPGRASPAAPSPTASPGCSRARGSRRRASSTRGWRLPSAGPTIAAPDPHDRLRPQARLHPRPQRGRRDPRSARRRRASPSAATRPGTSRSTTRGPTSASCATGRSASASPSSKAGGTASGSIR